MKTDYPHYAAKRVFLFWWKVVNEKGITVHYGWRPYCELMAGWLNNIFDLGYTLGRRDEHREQCRQHKMN